MERLWSRRHPVCGGDRGRGGQGRAGIDGRTATTAAKFARDVSRAADYWQSPADFCKAPRVGADAGYQCGPPQPRRRTKRIIVPTTETKRDPRQPRRLEKKANIC